MTTVRDLERELVEGGIPILMALAMMFFAKRQRRAGLFIAFAVGIGLSLAMGLARGWKVALTDAAVMLIALAGTLMAYRRLQPR